MPTNMDHRLTPEEEELLGVGARPYAILTRILHNQEQMLLEALRSNEAHHKENDGRFSDVFGKLSKIQECLQAMNDKEQRRAGREEALREANKEWGEWSHTGQTDRRAWIAIGVSLVLGLIADAITLFKSSH